MQMQNASRIVTVAPWSGLQQVIHSVEASCMRGEREWKMASPDGRAITLANNRHSRRAKVVKQGRSRSFGGLVRRSTRRAAATAAACAASPATRLVSIHGSPRCHTPASADLAPFAAPSVWAQIRPCFGSTTFEWNECTSVS